MAFLIQVGALVEVSQVIVNHALEISVGRRWMNDAVSTSRLSRPDGALGHAGAQPEATLAGVAEGC